jgi:hypothetical protein
MGHPEPNLTDNEWNTETTHATAVLAGWSLNMTDDDCEFVMPILPDTRSSSFFVQVW